MPSKQNVRKAVETVTGAVPGQGVDVIFFVQRKVLQFSKGAEALVVLLSLFVDEVVDAVEQHADAPAPFNSWRKSSESRRWFLSTCF